MGPVWRLVGMAGGFVAWAAQFTVIYGVTSVACARGYGETAHGPLLIRLAIGAATLAALTAAGLVLMAGLRTRRATGGAVADGERFIRSTTILISGLAMLSIVWQGLPGLIVPVCY